MNFSVDQALDTYLGYWKYKSQRTGETKYEKIDSDNGIKKLITITKLKGTGWKLDYVVDGKRLLELQEVGFGKLAMELLCKAEQGNGQAEGSQYGFALKCAHDFILHVMEFCNYVF